MVAHTFLLQISCTGTRQTTSSEESEMTQQESGLFKTLLGAATVPRNLPVEIIIEGRNKKASSHIKMALPWETVALC